MDVPMMYDPCGSCILHILLISHISGVTHCSPHGVWTISFSFEDTHFLSRFLIDFFSLFLFRSHPWLLLERAGVRPTESSETRAVRSSVVELLVLLYLVVLRRWVEVLPYLSWL